MDNDHDTPNGSLAANLIGFLVISGLITLLFWGANKIFPDPRYEVKPASASPTDIREKWNRENQKKLQEYEKQIARQKSQECLNQILIPGEPASPQQKSFIIPHKTPPPPTFDLDLSGGRKSTPKKPPLGTSTKKHTFKELTGGKTLEELHLLTEQKKITQCRNTLKQLQWSIDSYFNEYNHFPWNSENKTPLTSKDSQILKQLTTDNPKSIAFLNPKTLKNNTLLDPWGKTLRIEQKTNNRDNFTIRSAGKDGKYNTDDDITLKHKTSE